MGLAEDIADNFSACVWEPDIVKINAIKAASEATCLVLSVDETVKNPRAGGGGGGQPGMPPMGRNEVKTEVRGSQFYSLKEEKVARRPDTGAQYYYTLTIPTIKYALINL